MFEELGFMQIIESYGPDQFVITYHSMRRNKYDASIGFNIRDKTVHTVNSFSLFQKIDFRTYASTYALLALLLAMPFVPRADKKTILNDFETSHAES